MAAQDDSEADSRSSVTVRLQSKDRDSSQEFSLHRVRGTSSDPLSDRISARIERVT